MPKEKRSLTILRILANAWGLLTFFLFVYNFFFNQGNQKLASTCAVIYAMALALYVGNKEYLRWSKANKFQSMHFGEAYPVIWSIALIVFAIVSLLTKGDYEIPTEFTTTYITILGIYIISEQSKVMRKRG